MGEKTKARADGSGSRAAFARARLCSRLERKNSSAGASGARLRVLRLVSRVIDVKKRANAKRGFSAAAAAAANKQASFYAAFSAFINDICDTQMQPDASGDIRCLVCNRPALGGHHYGAISCRSCKQSFSAVYKLHQSELRRLVLSTRRDHVARSPMLTSQAAAATARRRRRQEDGGARCLQSLSLSALFERGNAHER